MSAYKYIINLAVLFTVLLTINTVSATESVDSFAPADKTQNHLIVGNRIPGDDLVLKQGVIKNASGRDDVLEKTFHVLQWERITAVEAWNQRVNERGVYASILQGGPGHSSVTIRFTQQRDHSINYIINIYARRT